MKRKNILTYISKIHIFICTVPYRNKIIKNIFLEYCHFTCTYVCTHVPIQSRKNKKGYFYQTMSINIPIFILNNCECVSKHYKSSNLQIFYQYTKWIIEIDRERRMSWPMPQMAWANFENCNHLLPLPYSCFVYCLCTKLPSYSWIDHHMQF